MACNRCYIVPPHLLQAMAASVECHDEDRQLASHALACRQQFVVPRKARIQSLVQPAAAAATARQSIIPDGLLRSLADSDDVDEDTRACARRDLEHIATVHARVHEFQDAQKTLAAADGSAAAARPKKKKAEKVYRAVYDAKHSQDESALPGKLVRKEGQAAVADKEANQAYDNVGDVIDMYSKVFDWHSIDNHNMPVLSSVHFGRAYQNAFWDPEKAQMVFGDGGSFIGNFTGALDVIGHEMTHAVTEHTSPLNYEGQAGALNEHVSDVFGVMIKQWKLKEKAQDADWLVGEDCLLPGVKGVALRSMKAPGTAYDDPRFGKDPQPDNFKDYKQTADDNGGVHIFSGIPNRAFYLAAVAFGGYSWEKAGQIWWKTMRSKLDPDCNFVQFADATVAAAKESSEDDAKTVRKAWDEVGVTSSSADDGGDDGGDDDGGDGEGVKK